MPDSLFCYDAEVAILNLILKNPELVYNLPNLRSYMFSSSPHTLIYATMTQLVEAKYLPDYSLVKNKLESDKLLDSIGGEETLKLIVSQSNKEENLKEFERQIIASYKAKQLLSSLSQASENAKAVGKIDDTILNLKTFLDNLDDTTGGDTTQLIGNMIEPIYAEIVNRTENPMASGIKFGIPDVDAATSGLTPGEMWIVAARPTVGKSAVVCNSALNAAKMGTPVLIFNQEMNKQAIVERFLAIETGIPLLAMRTGLKKAELEIIKAKLEEFKKLPIYIDCTFGMGLNYTLSTIRKYHKHNGVKLVYLDYIQLWSDRGEEQTSELGRISRALKLLAGELSIGIVVLSQLNRLVELREDKHPILSDLRQSGNLEEDADLVAFLYRDELYNPKTKDKNVLEYIIRKNRSGPIGTIMLKIDLPSNKITGYQ